MGIWSNEAGAYLWLESTGARMCGRGWYFHAYLLTLYLGRIHRREFPGVSQVCLESLLTAAHMSFELLINK